MRDQRLLSDGFVFHSSEWQMLKQIGNAVPPLMARALAAVAKKAIDETRSSSSTPIIPLDSYRDVPITTGAEVQVAAAQ